MRFLQRVWQILRALSGDDAYERYLTHWRAQHGSEEARPMTRGEFFKSELERKWNGVRRCC
ncbi:MAG: CstA-like transporter-associated (seleno)protein [Gammaproteobacteria bacterium]